MFDYTPALPGFFRDNLGDLFDDPRSAVGLSPDPELASLDKWLTLIGAPPGWFPAQCFRPTSHLLQPPEDPVDGGSLPTWFDGLADRPTVYVTLGTVFNSIPGVFDTVLTAVAGLDANVIVTVGRSLDPAAYVVPERVHVERFIPQALVLPHCDVVIAHGGYGSLIGALRRGIPIVTVPSRRRRQRTQRQARREAASRNRDPREPPVTTSDPQRGHRHPGRPLVPPTSWHGRSGAAPSHLGTPTFIRTRPSGPPTSSPVGVPSPLR
jgi:EryCIII-like glycosyltransferase